MKAETQRLIRAAVIEGLRAGINAHATHKDGDRLVGCTRRPIKRVFEEIETDERRAGGFYWQVIEIASSTIERALENGRFKL